MESCLLRAVCTAALLAAAQTAFGEIQITFTKLYGTNTTIPGRTETFAAVSAPAWTRNLQFNLLKNQGCLPGLQWRNWPIPDPYWYRRSRFT